MLANAPQQSTPASWPGFRVTDGANIILVKSRVCPSAMFGCATQNFSIEMLHWDDYCESIEPPAVKQPSMKEQFEVIPFAPVTSQIAKTSGETETFVFKCIAIGDGQYGSSHQNLQHEMIHYDDYMRDNGNAGTSMESLFRSFYGHSVDSFSTNGDRVPLLIKCITAAEQNYGAPTQNLSIEMLHWDDYCVAENIEQNGQKMKGLFPS